MKVIADIKEVEPIKTSYDFELTLTDGRKSKITILNDEGEFVLQGEDRQRFCLAEIQAIERKIEELNKKAGVNFNEPSEPDLDDEDEDEDEDDDENEY